MRLRDVIQRDTRANQPAATTKPVGSLYYVTDEEVLERGNGTTWDSYESGSDGDVVGPASAVANRIAAFDGTTGKLLKDGGRTIAEVETAFGGDAGAGGTKGMVPAPAAGDAAANKYLKSDGTWAAVVSGINQLTGDVTAGPGTGSQAATIANDAVTNAKAANMDQSRIKGRASAAGTGDPTDLTPDQVSTILDGATDPFLRTSAAGAASGDVVGPAGATADRIAVFNGATGKIIKDGGVTVADIQEWTTSARKTSNQDVENTTTVADATEIQLTVTADDIWFFRFFILYGVSNAVNVDFKWDLQVSAGAMRGWCFARHLNTADASAQSSSALIGAGFSGGGTLSAGGQAALTDLTPMIVEGMARFSANGTFKFRFAQNAAGGAGTFARVATGSTLHAKKIIP
jgi:hypothetical protein